MLKILVSATTLKDRATLFTGLKKKADLGSAFLLELKNARRPRAFRFLAIQ